MRVTKRDLLAVAVVAIVIVVLIMSTAHEKAKQVPIDDKHHAFYQSVEKGQDRIEMEKGA